MAKAKKTLQYGLKAFGQVSPRVVERALIVTLLEGLSVVRRGRMSDGTRVFKLDDGSVVYMQFQTEKQTANYR